MPGYFIVEVIKVDRTTIMAPTCLIKRVEEHVARTDGSKGGLTRFFTRAIVNQLEREGDYEIRDIMEEEQNASEDKEG